MLRKTTPVSFRALVEAARSVQPEIAITTDVIAGFPGETDEEFSETLAFVNGIQFAGGHVFTYSARPGTPAARMKNHIPRDIRKRRNAILRAAFAESGEAYRQQFIGQTASGAVGIGQRTDRIGLEDGGAERQLPARDSDCPRARWNRVDDVRLVGLEGEGMRGVIG
jgi:threonylcarbamoyladenosine tRNA methylthiotransferase MtaB